MELRDAEGSREVLLTPEPLSVTTSVQRARRCALIGIVALVFGVVVAASTVPRMIARQRSMSTVPPSAAAQPQSPLPDGQPQEHTPDGQPREDAPSTPHHRRPYLYVSFRGSSPEHPAKQGVNQVLRYEVHNGSAAPTAVLGHVHDGNEPRELRGLHADPTTNGLFVANAYILDSQILRYGPCAADGRRRFVGRVTPRTEPGRTLLLHPYGLAMRNDTLYTTAEDSATVLGLDVSLPLANSSGLTVVVSARALGIRNVEKSGLRGIAAHGDCLFVAEQSSGAVHPLCEHSTRARILIEKPVGLAVDAERGLLLVGSRAEKDPHVAAFDIATGERVHSFHHAGMRQPAGLVVDGHRLYVAVQDTKAILEFDVRTGQFVQIVVASLPDVPESVMMSDC